MKRAKSESGSALPSAVRGSAEEIARQADDFCAKYLDAEYAQLCRKMIMRLARKRPSPLMRGELRTWVGAVVYTVGSVNFLFDPSQRPHLTAKQLSSYLEGSKSTLSAKSRAIRRHLRIAPLDPEFCRRELLEQHPIAWLLKVSEAITDARKMPPDILEEVLRQELIPDPSQEESS